MRHRVRYGRRFGFGLSVGVEVGMGYVICSTAGTTGARDQTNNTRASTMVIRDVKRDTDSTHTSCHFCRQNNKHEREKFGMGCPPGKQMPGGGQVTRMYPLTPTIENERTQIDDGSILVATWRGANWERSVNRHRGCSG